MSLSPLLTSSDPEIYHRSSCEDAALVLTPLISVQTDRAAAPVANVSLQSTAGCSLMKQCWWLIWWIDSWKLKMWTNCERPDNCKRIRVTCARKITITIDCIFAMPLKIRNGIGPLCFSIKWILSHHCMLSRAAVRWALKNKRLLVLPPLAATHCQVYTPYMLK